MSIVNDPNTNQQADESSQVCPGNGLETIHPLKRSLFDADAHAAFRRRNKMNPDPWRRTLHGIFHNYELIDAAITRLPEPAQESFRDFFRSDFLQVVDSTNSRMDQSVKYAVRFNDALVGECVLLRSGESRSAVCVSSQVGCRAGCTFCATARMGLKRDLSADEILAQILFVAQQSQARNKRLRNIVFMGMGEPLHNESAVYEAIDFLIAKEGFYLPPRRINVSTVGVKDAMVRLADRFPGIQIAVSLHSAIPEKRRKLIPYMREFDWEEFRAQVIEVAKRPRTHRHHGPLMLEHLLIDGVNDTEDDSDALLEFMRGLPVMVNLIPFNPINEASKWKASSALRRQAFAKKLRDRGFFTTIRYSMGADVGAACGQLVQKVTNSN